MSATRSANRRRVSTNCMTRLSDGKMCALHSPYGNLTRDHDMLRVGTPCMQPNVARPTQDVQLGSHARVLDTSYPWMRWQRAEIRAAPDEEDGENVWDIERKREVSDFEISTRQKGFKHSVSLTCLKMFDGLRLGQLKGSNPALAFHSRWSP